LADAAKRAEQLSRAACRKEFEARFTVETMVDRYEEVYQRVMARRPSQAARPGGRSPSSLNRVSSNSVFK
jgi:hypothetical protein